MDTVAPLHSRASSPAGDDLERRLERRLVSMADRLWKKVLEGNEQIQDLQAELWRVSTEAARAGEAAAAAAEGALDRGELEAALSDLRAWAQQRADGSAAELDSLRAVVHGLPEVAAQQLNVLEAAVQGLREADAGTQQELQQVRDTSREATEELFGHVASGEEHMRQIRERLGALEGELARLRAAEDGRGQLLEDRVGSSEARLAELDAKLEEGLEASKRRLATVEASVRGQHEDMQSALKELQADAKELQVGIRAKVEKLRCDLDQQELQAAVETLRHESEQQTSMVSDKCQGLQQQLHKIQELQQGTHQKHEGLLQQLGISSAAQQQHVVELESELGGMREACKSLPPQLAACERQLLVLDQELDWMRPGSQGTAEASGHLVFPQRFEALHQQVAGLAQAVASDSCLHQQMAELTQEVVEGRSEHSRARRSLEQLEQATMGLPSRLEQLCSMAEALAERLDHQHGSITGLTAGLQAEAKERREHIASMGLEVEGVTRRQRAACDDLRGASERLEAALEGAEQRLGGRAELAAEETLGRMRELRELSSQRNAALQAELQQLAERSDQQRAKCLAAERRLEAMQPQLSAARQRAEECERKLQAAADWREASEQWQTAQEERLSVHSKSLRWLSDQCKEVHRHVDARIAEVQVATREDVAASTLSAFQGEMQLWAKLAQMNGQPLPLQGPPVRDCQAGLDPGMQQGMPAAFARSGASAAYPPPPAQCTGW